MLLMAYVEEKEQKQQTCGFWTLGAVITCVEKENIFLSLMNTSLIQ